MELKRIANKLVIGLATSGLTACGGAFDPPGDAAPLICGAIDEGQQITASGVLAGGRLTIQLVLDYGYAGWSSVAVPAVTGATLVSVAMTANYPPTATVVLQLGQPTEAGTDAALLRDGGAPFSGWRGSFTVTGVVGDCSIRRVFTVAVQACGVTIAEGLPIGPPHRAEIVVLGDADGELLLEGRTSYPGRHSIEWTVSGGEILETKGNRFRWRPPTTPGVHQVEALIDFADDGFALDVKRFTVG